MASGTHDIQAPFSGYPRTAKRTDWRGRTWYEVEIGYLHPLGARIADSLGALFAGSLTLAALYALSTRHIDLWWAWAVALLAPSALTELWRKLFRLALRSRAHVALSRDLIRIRGKSFDRHHVRGFLTRQHPHRFTEHRQATHRQRLAQRSRSVAMPRPLYYGEDTAIVTCITAGTVLKICTVFGLKDAGDILIRLNGINDALNGELGAGTGLPINPKADSPSGRGGIPR